LTVLIDARRVGNQEEERMAEYSVSDGKGKAANQFPPTRNLEIGQSMTALALEIKRGVETKYGERDVLHIADREDESILKSFWWPRKAPFPTLNMPFYIKRTAKNEWRLVVPDTHDEAVALWNTGEPPAGAVGVEGGVPTLTGPAAGILAKLKKK
jgi:hypothetical protein